MILFGHTLADKQRLIREGVTCLWQQDGATPCVKGEYPQCRPCWVKFKAQEIDAIPPNRRPKPNA